MADTFKSGFIALIGRPNSGKSTLLNAVLGERLAVVSPLPQTTRSSMKGIYTNDEMQLVFVDTPGIHSGKHKFNRSMFEESTRYFSDDGIDRICYIVDISRDIGMEEEQIAILAERVNNKLFIVFNKADICNNTTDTIVNFHEKFPKLSEVPFILLSSIADDAGATFIAAISKYIPEGPLYFSKDDITDSNMRFFAAEYIRKQIIDLTHGEIPHAAFVEILDYKEKNDEHNIEAVIHVESQGQKGIIIGPRGKLIAKIKKRAMAEMRRIAKIEVKINCHVKVSPRWRDNKSFLNFMGISRNKLK